MLTYAGAYADVCDSQHPTLLYLSRALIIVQLCVLIRLHVSSYYYICVLILLYVSPALPSWRGVSSAGGEVTNLSSSSLN
jgi:hypothetical protein